ncbi:hypothetical protein TH70_1859 [Streptococcus agalactiae]|nr:hypothetical protein TH70_1859 [Streptococcus agalactiae]
MLSKEERWPLTMTKVAEQLFIFRNIIRSLLIILAILTFL